jgi:hypothetical protein
MAEGKNLEKKMTLEETMRRMRPLFIMMMMFPFIGMVAAMVLIYKIQPKNLVLIEGMIFLSMVIFVATTYLFVKRMGQHTPKAKPA